MIILYNRQPTPGMEGRVKITPETGEPFYAKMEMADNPLHEGTPLSVETLLQHNTSALYGLTPEAVPDQVFKVLGQGIVTTGTANALLLNVPNVTLVDGLKFKFKLHVDMASRATLNINNTGDKAIIYNTGSPVRTGAKSGCWLEVIYSAEKNSFILGSKGGGSQPYAETLAHSNAFELLMGWYIMPTVFKNFQ